MGGRWGAQAKRQSELRRSREKRRVWAPCAHPALAAEPPFGRRPRDWNGLYRWY